MSYLHRGVNTTMHIGLPALYEERAWPIEASTKRPYVQCIGLPPEVAIPYEQGINLVISEADEYESVHERCWKEGKFRPDYPGTPILVLYAERIAKKILRREIGMNDLAVVNDRPREIADQTAIVEQLAVECGVSDVGIYNALNEGMYLEVGPFVDWSTVVLETKRDWLNCEYVRRGASIVSATEVLNFDPDTPESEQRLRLDCYLRRKPVIGEGNAAREVTWDEYFVATASGRESALYRKYRDRNLCTGFALIYFAGKRDWPTCHLDGAFTKYCALAPITAQRHAARDFVSPYTLLYVDGLIVFYTTSRRLDSYIRGIPSKTHIRALLRGGDRTRRSHLPVRSLAEEVKYLQGIGHHAGAMRLKRNSQYWNSVLFNVIRTTQANFLYVCAFGRPLIGTEELENVIRKVLSGGRSQECLKNISENALDNCVAPGGDQQMKLSLCMISRCLGADECIDEAAIIKKQALIHAEVGTPRLSWLYKMTKEFIVNLNLNVNSVRDSVARLYHRLRYEIPYSVSASAESGRAVEGFGAVVCQFVVRGCVKRGWEIPPYGEDPSYDMSILVQQIMDAVLESDLHFSRFVEILLSQPCRPDSPKDQYGEGIAGHSLLDFCKACDDWHVRNADFGVDVSEFPAHLTPVSI